MSLYLVTGGAGFIGTHVCVELLQNGHSVIILDNFSNSSRRSVEAVERITQRQLLCVEADLRDTQALEQVFSGHRIDAVLHFAGLKAVGESALQPSRYYDNNVIGSLRLIEAMSAHDVRTIVFSSSATVYGISSDVPISESCSTEPINPYGRTKLHVEEMLTDIAASDSNWRVSLLRYFNPVGAHATGEIGEDPAGIPNNLVPYISQVAVGLRPHVNIFGADYPTPDGTGIRDYIHVVDLAAGHLKALEYLESRPGVHVHNLGTGNGHSVLEMIRAFEEASGRPIPYRIVERRPGDAAVCYTDPEKANRELNWKAEYDIDRMCEDVWRWQSKHPHGFRE